MASYQLIEVPRRWFEYSYQAAFCNIKCDRQQAHNLSVELQVPPPQDVPFDTGLYADYRKCPPGIEMAIGQKLIWLSVGMLVAYIVFKIITK